jgi:hypothetical protein
MNTARFKSFSTLTVLPALALFALMQACGGSSPAVAQDSIDPIEGVWEGTATLTNCTTGAVLTTFAAASVYHRGGTMGDTNATPTVTRGPGFGTWTRNGSTYTIKFRFFAYDNTGALLGTRRVTRTVTLAANGQTATGTNSNELFNAAGMSQGLSCGTDTSTRVL